MCPNLDFTIGNLPNYHGQAVFNGGTVQIQNYKPMWANMHARFALDGPHVDLDRIDLDTDGAKTVAHGSVELGKRWPEQSYDFESRVQFPRMGEIFFSDQNWNLTGDGDFTGKFHLFKGGHDLAGTFKSDVLGWNDYRFPALYGSLHWTPTAFDVWDAGAKFFGGDAQFTYSIKPLGQKNVRSTSRFEASYENVDLAALHRFSEVARSPFRGLDVRAQPPRMADGTVCRAARRRIRDGRPAARRGADDAARGCDRRGVRRRGPAEWGPFAPVPLPAHVPIAAEFAYRFTADGSRARPGLLRHRAHARDVRGHARHGASSRASRFT